MASIETVTAADGQVRYRVRYRTGGRSVEQRAKTKTAARAIKRQVEADELTGLLIDPRAGAQRLADYAEQWLSTRIVGGRPLADSTLAAYRGLLQRNITPTLGSIPLRSLKKETIRSWYGDTAATATRDQAAKSYRLLHAILTTAVADDLIRVNPCAIRGGGQENAAERPMIATSLVLELAEAIDPRYRAMVLLAGFASLRTGESLGLRRSDVDLLHAEVHVRVQAQQVTGKGRVVKEPKSDAGVRTVVVPSVVVQALDDHLAVYAQRGPEGVVFTSPLGEPARRAGVSDAWRAACAATGAPEGLRLHDLRHHAATLTARMPGITTKELMARIGHSSPRAALRYQHATAERDRAIAAYLDDTIKAEIVRERAPIRALNSP